MSKLNNKDHIREVYTLLYTLPGIPSIYYGSEWGIEGRKQGASDDAMRPQLDLEKMQKENPHPELTAHIAALGKMRKENPVLADGIQRAGTDKQTVCLCKNQRSGCHRCGSE